MILNTFTKDEIARGIDSVVREFCNSSMPTGIGMKYEKAIRNRKVKDKTVLGVHRYNIQNNTVYVAVIKRTYNYSPRTHAELVFNYYISVTNPNTGKNAFVMPCFDITGEKTDGYTLFTEHFLQRLKERAGEDITDFIKSVSGDSHSFASYEDGKIESNWSGHRLFGYQYEKGKYSYITTMVTNDMLFDSQLAIEEDLKRMHDEFEEYKNSTLTV